MGVEAILTSQACHYPVGGPPVLPDAFHQLEVGMGLIAGTGFGLLEEHPATIIYSTMGGTQYQLHECNLPLMSKPAPQADFKLRVSKSGLGRALGKDLPTTRGDLEKAAPWRPEETRLGQVGACPPHPVVENTLPAARQQGFAFLLGQAELRRQWVHPLTLDTE